MNNLELGLTLEALLLASPRLPADKALRIVLLPGELYTIPLSQQQVRVLSGTAWVSYNGADYQLEGEESLTLEASKYNALISDAEGTPLVFEVA